MPLFFRKKPCKKIKAGSGWPILLLSAALFLSSLFPAPTLCSENQVAASRPLVVYGGDHYFPPFEYIDNRGMPAGFNIELMREVARRLGWEVEFRLGIWSEVIEDFKRGDIDIIAMFHLEERGEFADFGFANTIIFHRLFSTRGSLFIDSLESLYGFDVLVQQGGYSHDVLIGMDFSPENIIPVETEPGAVRAIAEGEGHIRHINSVLLAIRNVNQLIVRESDPESLIRKSADMLVETRGLHDGPDSAS